MGFAFKKIENRKVNMANKLQCFFFGMSFGEFVDGKQVGIAGFAIPDIGVVFRTKWQGTLYECQYAGLLSLLKFIEANHKSLGAYQFEILTDSALLVHQIAYKKLISPELAPLYNVAIGYKEKIDYRVSWVPRQENAAITGLGDSVPYKPEIDLNFKVKGPNIDFGNSSERFKV
jgi:hypothetical protein